MFKVFDKKIMNWVLGCSFYMLIAFLNFGSALGYYMLYRYLLGFLFYISMFSLAFVINYLFIIKIGKCKLRYVLFSLFFSTILLLYAIFGDYYLLKQNKYKVIAEYVDVVVVDYKDSYLSCGKGTGCHRIDNWAKYKLIDNNSIVRLYDVSKNSIGEKSSLVKLTYYSKKGNILFSKYKPGDFRVKYFSRDKEEADYCDLVNDLNFKLDLSVFGDNKIGFSKNIHISKINFSILNKLEFSKQLLNFSKDFFRINDYHGIQEKYNTNYGVFYVYNEPDCSYGILELEETEDYIVISIDRDMMNSINSDFENIENVYKSIIRFILKD